MSNYFGCGWFEWPRVVQAVEILSPVFSLGYPVEDVQLVFLFDVESNGVMLFNLWRSSSFLVSLGCC